MATRMQQRRGTAADWAAANPVLADGEIGFEIDTGNFKIGDGTSTWAALVSPFLFKSIIDAKGDLIVGTADNTAARIPVGSDGAALIADSTQAGGMAWKSSLTISQIVAAVTSASSIPIVGKGAVGQTADIFQAQNSSAQILARITANGSISAGGSIISGAGLSVRPPSATNVGAIVQGVSAQFANLQEWQNSAGTVVASVDPYGNITSPQFNINAIVATIVNNAAVGVIVKGAVGQLGNLQEWQNSSGTVISRVSPSGLLGIGSAPISGAAITATPASSANPGVVIRGVNAQSANLQEWQNFAGGTVASVNPSGAISALGFIGTGSWATYTPTWTAATTAPNIGNGTIQARYQQVGKIVVVEFSFNPGSTTNFGTGTWSFTLPPGLPVASSALGSICGGTIRCNGGNGSPASVWGAVAFAGAGATTFTLQSLTQSITSTAITTGTTGYHVTFPVNWGATSNINGRFFYETN